MIRLPKGKLLQKNLDTTYAKLDGVLRVLHEDGFVGYVRIVFEEDEGLIFFRSGELIASVYESKAGKTLGLQGLIEILESLQSGRAFIDICKLEHDLLSSILAVFHGRQLKMKKDPPLVKMSQLDQAAKKLKLTGTITCQMVQGDVEFFYSDAELLGMYNPQMDEWTPPEDVPENLAGEVEDCRLWNGGPNIDSLQTVDLNVQKKVALDGLQMVAEDCVPYYGKHLFDAELKNFQSRSSSAVGLTKPAFLRFGSALQDRCKILIGESRASVIEPECAKLANNIVDLGI